MGRKKNSVEKHLANLSEAAQVLAVAGGNPLVDAFRTRVCGRPIYEIANWYWGLAECERQQPNMADAERRKLVSQMFGSSAPRALECLMMESVRTKNGKALRLLASVVGLAGPMNPHDPTRSMLLALKCPDMPPMTARQVQEYVRKTSPDKTPSLKTVIRAAKELSVQLLKGKRGAPKGTIQKSAHRVSR